MPGTPSPDSISTKLARIATLARHRPALVLTSLAHHIDVAFLREAYRRTRKDAAVGVDGQTAEGYGANLEENLQALLGRLKAGTYKAPPVRRVHIAKAEAGKTRPIGIPTFEDNWEFDDGRHLAVSIETRKERGEVYSALRGFFRQYELYYVVADERDVVRLRTN